MPNRDVSEPFSEMPHVDPAAPLGGGRPADSSNRTDGYDEAQRAEIAEYEGSGRTDGVIMTDMDADLGGDRDIDEEEIEDNEDGLTQIIDTNEDIED